MTGRADWALELQLEYTEKQAVDREVKDAVLAAITYLSSGKTRHRRGGHELVKRIEVARLRASEEGEWHVVRLLQDCLDYSTGRILKPEFEERFQLFQDGARDDLNREYVARTFGILRDYARSAGQEFLNDHGDASAAELLSHLVSLADDGCFIDAPADRPGRYRIVRGRAEMALWLERIFRNRIDIEDPAAAARRLVATPVVLTTLVNDEEGQILLKAAELKRQAQSLSSIRKLIEDPLITEHELGRRP